MRLENEMDRTGADGDYDKTVAAIRTILYRKTLDEANSGEFVRSGGRGLNATGGHGHDPYVGKGKGAGKGAGKGRGKGRGGEGRGRGRGGPTEGGVVQWHEGLGNCRHCKQPGHLHKQCPKHAAEIASKEANQSGAAKIAKLEAELAESRSAAANPPPASSAPAPTAPPAATALTDSDTGSARIGQGLNSSKDDGAPDESEFVLSQAFLDHALATIGAANTGSASSASGHVRMMRGDPKAARAPVAASEGGYPLGGPEATTASAYADPDPSCHAQPCDADDEDDDCPELDDRHDSDQASAAQPRTYLDEHDGSIHLPVTAKFHGFDMHMNTTYIGTDIPRHDS